MLRYRYALLFILCRTKIICTVGSAASAPERLEALVARGMNVVQLNFSHRADEFYAQTLKDVRQISSQQHKPYAASGVPVGNSGTTSLIKVHSIGQPITA